MLFCFLQRPPGQWAHYDSDECKTEMPMPQQEIAAVRKVSMGRYWRKCQSNKSHWFKFLPRLSVVIYYFGILAKKIFDPGSVIVWTLEMRRTISMLKKCPHKPSKWRWRQCTRIPPPFFIFRIFITSWTTLDSTNFLHCYIIRLKYIIL